MTTPTTTLPDGRRKVPGEGDPNADIFVCGEAPGWDEDYEGQPWVGRAGRELTRYLERSAKVPRADCWLTNIAKYRPVTRKVKGNNPPTADDIRRDEPELLEELIRVKPKIIVAVGRYAARYFVGSRITMEATHGFAYPLGERCRDKILRMVQPPPLLLRGQRRPVCRSASTSVRSVQRKARGGESSNPFRVLERNEGTEEWWDQALVVVCLHPSAGLHQSEVQPHIELDFRLLGQYVSGALTPITPHDAYPDPDYYLQRTFPSPPSGKRIACDTESTLDFSYLWGGSYSLHPGSATVIHYSNKRALAYFRDLIFRNTTYWHNLPHDLRAISRMFKLSIYDLWPRVDAHCTLQMAYVHRLLPKGHKQLCKRLEDMEMEAFVDVVREPERRLCVEYLLKVLAYKCATCGGSGRVVDLSRVGKTGKPLQPMPTNCPDCEGDGTAWEPPAERIEWDPTKGRARIARGNRMGVRVRSKLTALEKAELAGVGVSEFEEEEEEEEEYDENTGEKKLKSLRTWWYDEVDGEFRRQVDDRLGPMREVTLGDADPKKALYYAARDSDGLIRTAPKIEEMVRGEGLWPVYEIDRSIIPIVSQMMEVGWRVDCQHLSDTSNRLVSQIDVLQYQLERLIGHYLNPNSSDQVASLLFDERGMKPVRFTDTGKGSTDNKVLKDLQLQLAATADADPEAAETLEALGLILGIRERRTLKSRYTDALPRMVDAYSRLHTSIKMATVDTWRLASADPNVQNIPSRTENGRLIRQAFVCEPGNVLIVADYSQAELRGLADRSGDKNLIRDFKTGVDIHRVTASRMYSIPESSVTSEQRRAAKTVNFGVIYRMGAMGLKAQLKVDAGIDVSEADCASWIKDLTARRYKGIAEYMDDQIAHARRYGYVETMHGWRRYLPGVHSPLTGVKNEAERMAVNAPIQGTVAGIVKLAMAAWWERMPKWRAKGYCETLMQEHDSLIVEAAEGIAEQVRDDLVATMVSVAELKVPVPVDAHIGRNWTEAKG